ncbi:GGDEF domain-containing protein [Caloramator mitchellensis]|uniref:GGDEF domain-containing protein n=1 Tax=Caloramator mitchellensis TaxID=908809 RepID=UPI001FA7F9B0|nr:GGDEF domain-containing protein [Caloramator mitchellensis]
MSKKLFKPYLYLIFTLGTAISIYYVANIKSYAFPLVSIFFMMVTVISEVFDYDGEANDDELSFSLSISNIFFLILMFNAIIAITSNIIAFLIKGLKLKMEGRYNKILNIKTMFNISQTTIIIFITEFLSKKLDIDLISSRDILKLAILILIFDVLNRLIVSLVISFHSGKLFLEAFKFKMFILYNYYSIILTFALIFSYKGYGLLGATIVYLMYIPFQIVTFRYTKLKEKERELFKDRLSGAYNYRYLEALINSKISKKEQFAICMMDFNNLKYINDNFGHVTGNQLIEFFAKVVNSAIDRNTVFCRYGGDEFCLIHSDYDELKLFINSINELLKTRFIETNGTKIYTSVSSGLYKYTGEEVDFNFIIDKVDRAMYKSKHKKGSEIVEAF